MTFKLCIRHRGLRRKKVYINDDPGFTTFLRARSNLLSNALVWKNVKTVDFKETIEFYDLKVGTYSLLSEYMKTCQGHCLSFVKGHLYFETSVPTLTFQYMLGLR